MGIWIEEHFDRGLTLSAQGTGRTRGFKVVGSVPSVAANEPEAAALSFGTPHPDDPGLVVNNCAFTPTGYGTEVRANYVPLEYIDQPPPENDTGIDWTNVDSTFEHVDTDIPIFQLVRKNFPTAGGGTEEIQVWQRAQHVKKFRNTRVVYRLTVNAEFTSDGTVNTLFQLTQAISNENNKLHTINGRKYLFNADGARRIDKDNYQFTYRWTSDPGIPNTLIFEDQSSPNIGGIGVYGFPFFNANYIIPPFFSLDAAPTDGDPTQAPTVVFSPIYLENPNGHLTLPGIA